MNDVFEICVMKEGEEPRCLGSMRESAITFNRYNKGLLIAAGKLSYDDTQNNAYMRFAAKFRNKAPLRFRNSKKTYFGDFCFINFIPETQTVVFGSIGPVLEIDTERYEELVLEYECDFIPDLTDCIVPAATM